MKLHILGTGHADVTHNYNTCFCLQNKGEFLLVDGGGGNTVLRKLQDTKIPLDKIENIFVSHNHNDHLFGVIWVLRITLKDYLSGLKHSPKTVFGSKICLDTIQNICEATMGQFWSKNYKQIFTFHEVKQGSKVNIAGLNFEFFDTLATDMPQMGFYIKDKDFVFAGDVPLDEKYHERFKGANYLCLEAFCSEREKEGKELPLLKHYSVVKAAQVGEKLQVKNLILWHTDDSLGKRRKRIYTHEANTVFHGNVIVPNDLETLEIK